MSTDKSTKLDCAQKGTRGSGRLCQLQRDIKSPVPIALLVYSPAQEFKTRLLCLAWPFDRILAIFNPSYYRKKQIRCKINPENEPYLKKLQILTQKTKNILEWKRMNLWRNSSGDWTEGTCCFRRHKCCFKETFHRISHLRCSTKCQNKTYKQKAQEFNQGYFWTSYLNFWAHQLPFPWRNVFQKSILLNW